MQKKIWFSSFFGFLSAIGFISAYNYYGSLSDILYNIDSKTLLLGASFLIFFAVLYVVLTRVNIFQNRQKEPNRAAAAVVALAVSALLVYGINKMDFDIENLFYDIGISSDILFAVVPLIIIAGLLFIILKFKKDSLIIIGLLLIGASFFVYEKTTLIVIGVILLLIRFFVDKRFWKSIKSRRQTGPGGIS